MVETPRCIALQDLSAICHFKVHGVVSSVMVSSFLLALSFFFLFYVSLVGFALDAGCEEVSDQASRLRKRWTFSYFSETVGREARCLEVASKATPAPIRRRRADEKDQARTTDLSIDRQGLAG